MESDIIMNLTEKEKAKIEKVQTEDDFYLQYNKIKSARNGFLPSYLVREILEIFNNKFPKNHAED
jgi:hypothetical protein